MVDDLDKKINSNEGNKENPNDLFKKFRDHLGYLANEVYETSKNAYDNALQSLEKWLSSREKKVQEDTTDALGKLRGTVDKQHDRTDISSDIVSSSKSSPWSHDFMSYDRTIWVQDTIKQAAANVDLLVDQSVKDTNAAASFFGRLMQKLMNTET